MVGAKRDRSLAFSGAIIAKAGHLDMWADDAFWKGQAVTRLYVFVLHELFITLTV
jgi:hypothetical protein